VIRAPVWHPVSLGQRGLWFEQQADPGSNAYNLAGCAFFASPIDASRLQAAIDALAARHPLMRARFALRGESPAWNDEAPGPACQRFEAPHWQAARDRVAATLLRPYDLEAEPPYRFVVVDIAAGGALLGIGCHHIASDLHSIALVATQLDTAYGDVAALAAPGARTYEQFVEWQRDTDTPGPAAWWREALAGAPIPASLGDLESGDGSEGRAAERIDFSLEAATCQALARLCMASGATPFGVLLTAMQVVLADHAADSRVVVGAPSSGRNDPRDRGTVGYFVNLLPLALEAHPGENAFHVLERNARHVRAALEHGQYPFAAMAQGLKAAGARQPGAIVQATLTFQKTVGGLPDPLARMALGLPGGGLSLGGVRGDFVRLPELRAQFPLGIAVAPVDGGFEGCLTFDPARIAAQKAKAFLHEWLQVLERWGAARREVTVAELLDPRSPRDLATALLEAAKRRPESIALFADDVTITYGELDARSASLAASLGDSGVARDHRVAVVGAGGVETVVALVAVLRSGAAFVPIDAGVPAARMTALLDAARVSVVVACEGASLPPLSLPVLRAAEAVGGGAAPAVEPHRDSPAWLMFTSGTTGEPKAALVPHSAAVAHARAIARRFALGPGDRVLQFASLSFDEHAEEIFPTLLAGAAIVCRPRIRFQDPESMLEELERSGVTVLHLPTSYWHLWMDEAGSRALPFPRGLRLVNAGGESPSAARLRNWARLAPANVRWFNTYGLTEAAVTSFAYEARGPAPERIPAGRPLSGVRARIVAADGDDAEAGTPGELHIGGEGVGSGYFGNPQASAERFYEAQGVRWLRTGDLAFIDAEGQLVVVGRKDRELKVRGTRIDAAEVEAMLGRHPAVLECLLARSERSEGELELFVATRPGHAIGEGQVLDFWRETMPGVPPPRSVSFCSGIPRTAGRKPDLAALRAMHAPVVASAVPSPPADALEARIAAIFRRLLGRPVADAAADFYALGGHSLLAMRLVASVRHELGVPLTIADFLARPTIAGVALACRGAKASPEAPVHPMPVAGTYPLSRAQSRLLAMSRAAGIDPMARMEYVLHPGVDLDRLRRAWREVAGAQTLLHARIDERGNEEMAPVPQALELLAVEDDGGGFSGSLKRSADGWHLVVRASLLAIDGAAAHAFMRRLADAYENATAEPPGGYREFVAAEAAWLASAARPAAAAFWEEILRDAPAPIRLAGAKPRRQDPASRTIRLRLGDGTRAKILAFAVSRRCTPFAVLLSAFATVVARFGASRDLVLGVPVSVAGVLGVGEAPGPALNPVPLRLRLEQHENFASQLARIRDLLAALMPHAALPIEEIVAASPQLRSLRREPMPIQFVSQEASHDSGLVAREVSHRDGYSPAELLVGVRTGARFELHFEYRTGALDASEVVALARAFRLLLAQVLADPCADAMNARLLPRRAIEQRVHSRPSRHAPHFPTSLHTGLELQARRDPARVALVHAGHTLTYGMLDALAKAHAQSLIDRGMRPGDRVEVTSRKGMHEIVAALAVLKAGGVYVPISADMPAERAARLRSRAEPRLATGAPGLAPAGVEYVPVDLSLDAPCAGPRIAIGLDDSAYILFTSGSTGEPKGVEVSHRAAMLTIAEMLGRFEIGQQDVVFGFSALDFDLSVFDIFGTLAAGARLMLPTSTERMDAFAWAADVHQHGVSVWNSVPAALGMLLDAQGTRQCASMRRILASGDWIPLDLPARARAAFPNAMFVALGGATEAAIWSNCHVVEEVDDSWRSIPYGRPLDGQVMFVAEPSGWPVPAGVVGEILIGGGGLAKGYHGMPELTAERFVRNAASGERVYRTGDLGRHFPDGAIEFLGRVDRQLKVRGFRIEPGEIEAVLSRHASVARVLVSTGAGETLVAYVVAREGASPDFDALRGLARDCLPEYMRPGVYCLLERLPLTANGKVDMAALPAIGEAAAHAAQGALGGELVGAERRIAAIWHELLPMRAPQRDTDFFAAGGHSLLAVRLLARVRQELGIELSLPEWLREPTVAHLARMVSDGGGQKRPVRTIAALREKVRLAESIRFSIAPDAGKEVVLVTGAAGLIGRRLVAELAAAGETRIVCLVRAGGEGASEARIREAVASRGAPMPQRLHVIGGDLEQVRFGLPPAAFESLAANVSRIFHVGARVNLVASYEALEAANVGGTHEAIRLAAAAGATLHHVSSVGVLPYGAGRRVLESDPIDVEGELMTGYCESKWVAEGLVRLAMGRGLRATIHRPGLTLAAEDEARGGSVLAALLALVAQLGALPKLAIPVDIVDADYVAGALVRIAANPRALSGTFHLTHPQPVMLPELVAHLAPAGLEIPFEDYESWRERLGAIVPSLQDEGLAALAALIASHDERSITPATVDCSQALRMLGPAPLECPAVTRLVAPLLLAGSPAEVMAPATP